jgi:hypothetical protein
LSASLMSVLGGNADIPGLPEPKSANDQSGHCGLVGSRCASAPIWNFACFACLSRRQFGGGLTMRMRRYWTDAEVEKLRSMAGNCSLDQIAQKLGRPRGSVATKAHDLKVSLSYHRRRPEPGSMDPAPAGVDLTGGRPDDRPAPRRPDAPFGSSSAIRFLMMLINRARGSLRSRSD